MHCAVYSRVYFKCKSIVAIIAFDFKPQLCTSAN